MGYAFTPEAVCRDANLSMQARALWTLLASYAGKKAVCWPSQAELAKHSGCTDRTVRRLVEELESWGYVHVRSGGPRKPCTYTLSSVSTRTPVSGLGGHQCPKEVSQGTSPASRRKRGDWTPDGAGDTAITRREAAEVVVLLAVAKAQAAEPHPPPFTE
jgi:DNA-binding transcriptional MocR family regulator